MGAMDLHCSDAAMLAGTARSYIIIFWPCAL
jgi:hypothetical protein